EQITLRQSFLIGIFQCCALWPGVSRSGATIIGAMLVGVERKAAAEFSFLVAVPVMTAATAYDLYKSGGSIPSEMYGTFAVGFIVSLVTAVFAIRFFLKMLARYSLAPFGYYRVALALFVLVALTGWLPL
ncbi:MAG: undecaprenyl-diphosphate phosphatase, partial [Bdellovibrionales bacterium]|nr:undecaprenyl-diphosphate phosphatase [Bdellovibrionales bacterium]